MKVYSDETFPCIHGNVTTTTQPNFAPVSHQKIDNSIFFYKKHTWKTQPVKDTLRFPKMFHFTFFVLDLFIKRVVYLHWGRGRNTVPQSREHNSGPRIWLTDHNTVVRPGFTIHIRLLPFVCGWCPEYTYHMRNDRTIMSLF